MSKHIVHELPEEVREQMLELSANGYICASSMALHYYDWYTSLSRKQLDELVLCRDPETITRAAMFYSMCAMMAAAFCPDEVVKAAEGMDPDEAVYAAADIGIELLRESKQHRQQADMARTVLSPDELGDLRRLVSDYMRDDSNDVETVKDVISDAIRDALERDARK